MNEHIQPTLTRTLTINSKSYRYIDLLGELGNDAPRVPYVIRLLMENALRCRPADIENHPGETVRNWLRSGGISNETLAFFPARLLMEDTTCTPAFVDIAAMRDVVSQAGGDPRALNPVVPIDASIDHSIVVDYYAMKRAAERNLKNEFARNEERYKFLRWAADEFSNVRVHPPGTGIMHTLNAEQLATVVSCAARQGDAWLFPDTVLGTDSHTPLINGLGVLGWGVGGLEAEAIMFGQPATLRIPEVVGVRLTGSLRPGILAMDLALAITQCLRNQAISGEFVEFFGPGVSCLSAGDRCVVASMAPEFGATTGYFPVDQETLKYLHATGRSVAHTEIVVEYMRHTGLWFDPTNEPMYTRVIDLDLDSIRRSIAGPRRPQDLLPFGDTAIALAPYRAKRSPSTTDVPEFPIAIAAVTSCTNTTDPKLLIAAGLLARKARSFGLKVPRWVKTSLGPGSPAAARYLERAGLMADFAAVGFDIVGFGCTTCIGNSGPLTAPIYDGLASDSCHPVAVLSGNRNFPGRVHPEIDLAFIMSPPLVIAFALAGDAVLDLDHKALQVAPDGTAIFLKDIWPSQDEIDVLMATALLPSEFKDAFNSAGDGSPWNAISYPEGPCYPWGDNSTVLKPPPYVTTQCTASLAKYIAFPLIVMGDDITTDHIAPGSAIPIESLAGQFLKRCGVPPNEFGAFSARRGNWEVMLRATFYNKSLRNLLQPDAPVGFTLHVPSGQTMPIFEAAALYRNAGHQVVVIAGARYGMGSSRDWAAKGPWLLGVKAVLAVGIERIHRTNLIGMGILPLLFPENLDPHRLALRPGDRVEIDARVEHLEPLGSVNCRVLREDRSILVFTATADIETWAEINVLKAGGIIPSVLTRILN